MAKRTVLIIFTISFPLLLAFSFPASNEKLSSNTDMLSSASIVTVLQDYPNDFGDAPESYGTADHVIISLQYLGASAPDGEPGSQFSPEADGDDLHGSDDEDGVAFPAMAQGATVVIAVSIFAPFGGYLNVWIDWNGDGDFDDKGERVASDVRRTTGNYDLKVDIPDYAIASRPTFARFRFGPKISTPTGTASSGEVEDYMIKIDCVFPEAPVIGQVTQPSCESATGSVVLGGLPSSGTWTLTRFPDGETISGSGITYTVTGIEPGSYQYTVTNEGGCTSGLSAEITINNPPLIPPAPVVEAIAQPTCAVATGAVSLTGLPGEGTWTVLSYPGAIPYEGSGVNLIINGLEAGTYFFTVTLTGGCTSDPSAEAVINQQPPVPAPPVAGTITDPSCSSPGGSVELLGLPATGSWIVTRYPGEVTTPGTGTSTVITGLAPGTYTFNVTNAEGCTSDLSEIIIINTGQEIPPAPVPESVTQPSCNISTGSVLLTGLPSTGSWTLTRMPDGLTYSGTGTTTVITGMAEGTYTFTVTNADGCISLPSSLITIYSQPVTPAPPVPGNITQPTCDLPTGSVVISGLPDQDSWTLTRFPGSIAITSTGTSILIYGLYTGAYNFTVTNSSGCTSAVSADVIINPQPGPVPTLIIHNPAPVCSPGVANLTSPSVTSGSTPGIILTYWTDIQATIPMTTPSAAPEGTYYIRGTIAGGCSAVGPVTVTGLQSPVADAGSDQELIYMFTATLGAAPPDEYSTGMWSVESGSGEFDDPDNPVTRVKNLSRGENVLLWSVSNGACPPAVDDVTITVRDLVIPSLITPDMDDKNDYFKLVGIEELGNVELSVFDRRGVMVFQNPSYDNLWHGTDYNGVPLPDDIYFYIIKSETGLSLSGYLYIRR